MEQLQEEEPQEKWQQTAPKHSGNGTAVVVSLEEIKSTDVDDSRRRGWTHVRDIVAHQLWLTRVQSLAHVDSPVAVGLVVRYHPLSFWKLVGSMYSFAGSRVLWTDWVTDKWPE